MTERYTTTTRVVPAKIKSEKSDAHKRVDKLFNVAMRLLLLGMTPDQHFGKFGYQHVILYTIVVLLYLIYGLFELVWVVVTLPEDILDMLGHLYIAVYCIAYGIQWLYVTLKLKEIYQNRIDFKSFQSTTLVETSAENILKKNLKFFKRTIILFTILLSIGTVFYIFWAIVQFIIQYATTGTADAMVILSYFPFPFWGQMAVACVNIMTMVMSIITTMSIYVITSLLCLEVETQCMTIKEAFACDTMSRSNSMRGFVIEHVRLIKHTRWLIELLENINRPIFISSYAFLSVQMFMLTSIEPEGHFYLTIFVDFLVAFFIMASHCWIGSTITNSMLALSEGPYTTHWYLRNKSNARDVIMMTQMAQRPYVPTLFLGTLKIEMGTMIEILQQSYSFYTILLALQKQK